MQEVEKIEENGAYLRAEPGFELPDALLQNGFLHGSDQIIVNFEALHYFMLS